MTPNALFSCTTVDQRQPVSAWARHDLGQRFGSVVTERLPQEMLDMLAVQRSQE